VQVRSYRWGMFFGVNALLGEVQEVGVLDLLVGDLRGGSDLRLSKIAKQCGHWRLRAVNLGFSPGPLGRGASAGVRAGGGEGVMLFAMEAWAAFFSCSYSRCHC